MLTFLSSFLASFLTKMVCWYCNVRIPYVTLHGVSIGGGRRSPPPKKKHFRRQSTISTMWTRVLEQKTLGNLLQYFP